VVKNDAWLVCGIYRLDALVLVKYTSDASVKLKYVSCASDFDKITESSTLISVCVFDIP